MSDYADRAAERIRSRVSGDPLDEATIIREEVAKAGLKTCQEWLDTPVEEYPIEIRVADPLKISDLVWLTQYPQSKGTADALPRRVQG